MTETLTIGERVAWYRRRRGMSQEVLAGLVGRTTDWLSKVENNKIDLDRLSVIKALADALDVTIGDLLGEPSLMDWTADARGRTVPALREALMDYRQLTPLLRAIQADERPDLDDLHRQVGDVWTAYQRSRYAYATRDLPTLLAQAQTAAQEHDGDERLRAHALLALTYQGAAMVLTKIGETDLAWIAADRGLNAAQTSGDPLVIGSLFRSVTHCLLSNGRFAAAKQLTEDAAAYLQPGLSSASPEYLSIYGTLFLAGSVAAARSEDRATTRAFLAEADEAARRLGVDANHLWTAFGPTNVAIHRVTAAMELGDVQIALDQGPKIDASALPIERRVRHALELARAYSARNRVDKALSTLLDAEQLAPEQVRYHFISRQLVTSWVRQQRGKPSYQLAELARRLRVI
ncbi:XRE family transcriptional regulator [Carbonactinospora thermoautotrophica]|uniref:XRE family transcriptional regulator n=2 Tax=Carbonactinospora thermoautotrophica TaxID=1469144 RepID=A0A132MJC6_9ACTN|nr:helix-turn-helix transcriptional regulator [Carbonactinospora thermoautotrophica]KWW97928.1 XRE family transcriptional regulator [Carbonactinospora thermoautotrophica]KWX09353.1 XRE family transcriptional regulator [Carbonactinospora thermoautotrophica]